MPKNPTIAANNVFCIARKQAASFNDNLNSLPIVYKDSEGQYDGINGEKLKFDTFYHIGATSEKDAVTAAIERRTR